VSADPFFSVFCDAPGCLRFFEPSGADAQGTAAGARREARSYDWKVPVPAPDGSRSRSDFCPTHAKEASR
jgi:hypothetical protein